MGELEFLKWFLHEFGAAAIPALTALVLAWRVFRDSRGDLFDDYHAAIVEMTKALQELKTLLDERTRTQDARQASQDNRQARQDARHRKQQKVADDQARV